MGKVENLKLYLNFIFKKGYLLLLINIILKEYRTWQNRKQSLLIHIFITVSSVDKKQTKILSLSSAMHGDTLINNNKR